MPGPAGVLGATGGVAPLAVIARFTSIVMLGAFGLSVLMRIFGWRPACSHIAQSTVRTCLVLASAGGSFMTGGAISVTLKAMPSVDSSTISVGLSPTAVASAGDSMMSGVIVT